MTPVNNLIPDLISEVRSRCSLWMSSNSNFRNNAYKQKMYEEIGEKLNLSVDDVKKKWKHCKDKYRRELKKSPKIAEGAESDHGWESKWSHFNAMGFLRSEICFTSNKNKISSHISSLSEDDEVEDCYKDVNFVICNVDNTLFTGGTLAISEGTCGPVSELNGAYEDTIETAQPTTTYFQYPAESNENITDAYIADECKEATYEENTATGPSTITVIRSPKGSITYETTPYQVVRVNKTYHPPGNTHMSEGSNINLINSYHESKDCYPIKRQMSETHPAQNTKHFKGANNVQHDNESDDLLGNDSDYMFLRSILPIMQRLTDYQKLLFRCKINALLMEVMDK